MTVSDLCLGGLPVLEILHEGQLGFFTSSSAMASEGSPLGESETVKRPDEVYWLSILPCPLPP